MIALVVRSIRISIFVILICGIVIIVRSTVIIVIIVVVLNDSGVLGMEGTITVEPDGNVQ